MEILVSILSEKEWKIYMGVATKEEYAAEIAHTEELRVLESEVG